MAAFDPNVAEKMKALGTNRIDVIKTSGPGFVTKNLFTYLSQTPESKVLILPTEYFYPLSNQIRD
jgi:hypothetical protein